MKEKWNDKNLGEKVMLAMRMVLSVVVVVLAALQLMGKFAHAMDYAVPLLGVCLFLQSVQERNRHRVVATICLCAALFVFAVSVVVWFVK